MGQCDALVSRGMSVSVQNCSCVDSYLDFGCTTSDYTPLLNGLVLNVVILKSHI